MGNVFSGGTEDLLLYFVLPLATLGLAVWTAALEYLVTRRLAARRESWRDPLAPRSEPSTVDYRAPASAHAPAGAPSTVRWLARAAVAWGAATLTIFSIATVCTAALAGPWLAALVPITATVAAVTLIRASLVLPDRHDASVPPAIDAARRALLVHHAVLFVLGTSLLALVILSDHYFWNSPSPRGTDRLVGFLVAYAVAVLAPCALGLGLARWLRAVRPLYAPMLAR